MAPGRAASSNVLPGGVLTLSVDTSPGAWEGCHGVSPFLPYEPMHRSYSVPPDTRTTNGLKRDVLAAGQRYSRLRLEHSQRLSEAKGSTNAQMEELLKAKVDLMSQEHILEARLTLQEEQLHTLHVIAGEVRALSERIEALLSPTSQSTEPDTTPDGE